MVSPSYKRIPESKYYELCQTIAEFHEAPNNDTDPDYLSDGEWLDVFYELCVKLKKAMETTD